MFVCIQLFESFARTKIEIESRLHCIDIHDDDCTILFYYRSEDFPDIVPGKLIFSILKHKTYLKDNFFNLKFVLIYNDKMIT